MRKTTKSNAHKANILTKICLSACILATLLTSCRVEEPNRPDPQVVANSVGFYLLNQGNMGSNKASIDYYDYATESYRLNVFEAVNPNVGFKLGDVGNDLQIYGGRMYAVINLSNMVEVMDKKTAKHIGNFPIPNCRYIVFKGDKAYVSSYAGPVGAKKQLGFVAEIDTVKLTETRRVTVGYQPDQLQVVKNRLYVANSGGYDAPDYDRTVSVIDLETFKEIKKIDVGINLYRMQKDKEDNLYISSRGNYVDISSNIYKLNTGTEQIESLGIESDAFIIMGDSLFSISTNYTTQKNKYILYDLKNRKIIKEQFISEDIAKDIKVPYYIDYNPQRGEIYICDAETFIVPGELFCFTKDGTYKWRKNTGDIPAAIAFLNE